MQKLVPGGGSTYSKRVSAFGSQHEMPAFAQNGDGAYLFDVDGNRYVDYVCGLAPILLGYNHPEINAAIVDQLKRGMLFSLPTELEVELAETLVELLPSVEMVKLFKTGAEGTSAAIRAARMSTGRAKILNCGYHGWHDWWAGTQDDPGVPLEFKQLSKSFAFNDLEAAASVMREWGGDIAAIIVTPALYGQNPAPGFLEGLRSLCDDHGSLLVFDEIITGFRFALGGAHEKYGVAADLHVFAKAIANGMPLAVLGGKSSAMSPLAQSWVTSTYAGETLSIVSALKTIEILKRGRVYEKLGRVSHALHSGMATIAASAGLDVNLNDCLNALRFDFSGDIPNDFNRRLLVESVNRGVLLRREGEHAISLCLNAALSVDDVNFTLDVIEHSVKTVLKANP